MDAYLEDWDDDKLTAACGCTREVLVYVWNKYRHDSPSNGMHHPPALLVVYCSTVLQFFRLCRCVEMSARVILLKFGGRVIGGKEL